MQQATLPSWQNLQQQFNVLFTQLSSLSTTMSSYSETLQRTVAYPLPNFPTVQQQNLLTTLLRKKNLPSVDEWIEQGKEASKDISLKQDDEFCNWAIKVVEQHRDDHQWSGLYT